MSGRGGRGHHTPSGGRGGGRGRHDSGRGRSGGGGRGGRGGGGGRGPPTHCPPVASSNLVACTVSPLIKFYVYGIDAKSKSGQPIDSRSRRGSLFNMGVLGKEGLIARSLEEGGVANAKKLQEECNSWRRILYFQNSVVFSPRALPVDLSNGPVPLVGGGDAPTSDNGDCMTITDVTVYGPPVELATRAAPQASGPIDAMAALTIDLRCSDCTKSFVNEQAMMLHCKELGHSPVVAGNEKLTAANKELFLQYANVVLSRALSERLAPWGREYIDPKSFTDPTDRDGRSLGVRVFKAFVCEFGLHKSKPDPSFPCTLNLTVDLRAKIMRTTSLLDVMSGGNYNKKYSPQEIADYKRKFNNEIVIAIYDKKCYSVKDIHFDKSPASFPIQGKGNISHADYFAQRKQITLKYPNAAPMVEVLGRNNSSIFLPSELVCANELDTQIKSKLPMIASFTPQVRHAAIEEIRRYLIPGAQKSQRGKDLLPSLGFTLSDSRVSVRINRMPLPIITAAGIKIPESMGGHWAPHIAKANYKVNPNHAVLINVVLVHHKSLKNYMNVYNKIKKMANDFNSTYRLGEKPYQIVQAGDKEQHWGAIEKYFGGKNAPDNTFVLDLSRPPRGQSSDPAYSVVKSYLGRGGYISQFVNHSTYNHDQPRDVKKSDIILSGVARQILSKCGVRIWWVNIPKSVPLPAVFVGVDVYHAPRKYDAAAGKRTAKESVAAVIVSIIREHESRPNSKVEVYCETEVRSAGREMQLDTVMNRTVANALKTFNVTPKSCFIWRDGVGDNTIKQTAEEEIPAVKKALKGGVVGSGQANADCPLAYIVCQKRINTKFLTDKGEGLPAGACVTDLQGPEYKTFYINGTSPSFSTPKPVRFVIAHRDVALNAVSPTELTWALCHDYPNWTGPIKLPAPTQLAHKLAELAGGMVDCGRSIDHQKYAGKVYFL